MACVMAVVSNSLVTQSNPVTRPFISDLSAFYTYVHVTGCNYGLGYPVKDILSGSTEVYLKECDFFLNMSDVSKCHNMNIFTDLSK